MGRNGKIVWGAVVPVAAGAAGVLAACGASARAVPDPPCARRTAAVVAGVAGYAAEQIYANEVHGSKVAADRRQVETYAPLLRALRAGDGAGVRAAVSSLVFSHTHIVRLRVGTGAGVRADVGGSYILAPVAGTLSTGSRAVGRYVLSVQDDLGYVKLVKRFIGAQVVLRRDSEAVPVRGVLAPAPASIPGRGQLSYQGHAYAAYSFTAHAFPQGRLRVSVLVPLSASLENERCAAVAADEARAIAQRTARRYRLAPLSFYPYAAAVRRFTGGLVFIHVGRRRVTGSPGRGPADLPPAGNVDLGGADYRVASFQASGTRGRVTVYVLRPE